MNTSINKNRINNKPKAILYEKNNRSYYYKSITSACRGLNIAKETLYKYLKIGKWKGGTIKLINKIPENYKKFEVVSNAKTNIKIAMCIYDLVKMLKYYDTYCKDKNNDESIKQFINDFMKFN